MIKILYLLEATLGGTRRHVIDLLKGISTSNNNELEIHFGYSLQRADSNFQHELEQIEASGIKCFECNMSRSINLVNDIKIVIQIVSYIKEHKISIVHAHSAKAGYVGRLAAKLVPGTRSIYTPNSSPFRLSALYRFLEIVAGWCFSDAIIAVSKSEKCELVKNKISSANKVYIVNSGIPETEYEPELDSQFQYKDDSILYVGTVARLAAQKVPHRFVEIAEAVIKIKPNVKFVWIGDGELREELEKLIDRKSLSNNVFVTGWTKEVEQKLLLLDVFLLASDYESFGYVTVEAMRAGLPCVVSDVSGSCDLVINGETGFTIDRSNINEYANSLIKLLNDAKLRGSMGKAGRERWKKEFQAAQMVSSTLEVYHQVLKSPQSLVLEYTKAIF